MQNQNQEIKQDNLKTQIVSAISDLEGDRDLADFGRENKTIDLMSPPQAKSPTPKQQTPYTPTKQVSSKNPSLYSYLKFLNHLQLWPNYGSLGWFLGTDPEQ